MKIGQLTFHASHNYGSVLQAYALSRQLQTMGHETEFINLRPKAQKDAYKIITGGGIHRVFHYLIYPALKRRYENYERFINEVLPVTEREYSSTEELMSESFDYDAYVCGGDQIWNPACQDFETAYFLQFLPNDNAVKKIAYSPSFGKLKFEKDILKQMGEWAGCFDSIAVREKAGENLLKSVCDKSITSVCDPVILLDKAEWEKLAATPKYKKPYILVYFLENNHGSRSLIDYLHKALGYDVVLLNEYMRDFVKPFHKSYDASPEAFIGLFMNAGFIYTNSFHGTAFATIFEKPFLTAIATDQANAANNNDSRKIDYLKRLDLENRLYQSGIPDKNCLLNIDFVEVGKKREAFREESYRYLEEALR